MKKILISMLAITGLLQVFGQQLSITLLSRYDHNLPTGGEVEIVAPYDSASQRLFVNLQRDNITIIDISDPLTPDSVGGIDISPYGTLALNVAVHNSLVAVAVQGATKQDSGKVVFFDTNGTFINEASVGPAPGMLSYTPNGRYIVVANEGIPTDDYLSDPEGSITIIDLINGASNLSVVHIGFTDYNIGESKENLFPASVHIYGPGAKRAQDMEPEFVAISDDGQKAYVSLQENNAVMMIDVPTAEIDTIFFLGYKDHNAPGNMLDASDQDGGILIVQQPVFGMYQPDGLAAFSVDGTPYFLTANEGAARKYGGFNEEVNVVDLLLDPSDFSDISLLQSPASIGRLKVSNSFGDIGSNGIMDRLYSFGGRSFSIWNGTTGELVYDSGDDFEQLTATLAPTIFNSTGVSTSFDNRSDNKGPEPEDVVIGKVGSRYYAFIGLEQIGGIMVYDITNPTSPTFITYEPAAPGDVSPEASVFIEPQQSPTGEPLLIVSFEESSTLAIYALSSALSVIETHPETALHAYPNPFNNTTSISLELAYPELITLELFTAEGRFIEKWPILNSKAGLNTITLNNKLPAGIYFIVAKGNTKSSMVKLISIAN